MCTRPCPPGWIHHHWDSHSLDGVRHLSCGSDPYGKCAAPVLVPGHPRFENVTVRPACVVGANQHPPLPTVTERWRRDRLPPAWTTWGDAQG
jgi:hypothetical protein